MTLHVTIGIDPGLSGAVAALADGEPCAVIDMPTRRMDGQNEVCAASLADSLRHLRSQHPGAAFIAVVERVNGRKGWGATQGFRFGAGYGKVKAVLETLGIAYREVQAPVWKRHYALKGGDKDASRDLAQRRFPSVADDLRRKKDDGRAEALLIALWADSRELRAAA